MRVILDTHTLLWYASDSPRLSQEARSLLTANDAEKCLSVASCWEIAIKLSLGKLKLPGTLEDLLQAPLSAASWTLLSPGLKEFVLIGQLPYHHRDPFDRMLVAHAIALDLPLVSNDEQLDRYSIDRRW